MGKNYFLNVSGVMHSATVNDVFAATSDGEISPGHLWWLGPGKTSLVNASALASGLFK